MFINKFTLHKSKEVGSSMVEAAITLPIFFILVICLTQVCFLLYTYMTVQYISTDINRKASVRREITKGEDRYTSISKAVIKELELKGLNTNNTEINMCVGVVVDCNDKNAGGPNSIVTLQIKQPVFKILGPKLVVAGRSIIKNESF